MNTQENGFIPTDYEAPTGGGGFTKLQNGDNKMRILSSPLMLWTVWADKKVSRIQYKGASNKPAKPAAENASVKHSWGLIIWNYATDAIEVFELDKQAIIGALTTYAKDPDWGHPKEYDIVINKSGSGMDTEYTFVAKPAKPVTDQIIEAYAANPVDLAQLLVENGNPFLSNGGASESKEPASKASKIVTPENWTDGDPVPKGYKVVNGALVKDLPF